MDKNKCNSCGKTECACKNKDFTKSVIEIDNPPVITNIRKVVIPTSMGDDTTVPPVIGKYHNVLLNYEANNKSYLYSSDGIPTLLTGTCTCHKNLVTHLVLSNPTTATWNRTGTIGTVYPTSASVSIDTFASTDVVFTKDDSTTMTVGDLYTALTNGESFEIDLPFGEINSTCYYGSDEAAIVATVENAKLDGSSKQTLDQTSQGRLSEMYTSSVPVAVTLSVPGGVLLDERFGVEHLTIDDDNTVTSSYRFVVNTYSYHEPLN